MHADAGIDAVLPAEVERVIELFGGLWVNPGTDGEEIVRLGPDADSVSRSTPQRLENRRTLPRCCTMAA